MANISQIKLPNGDVYNFQDSVSGYLVPSDIEGKVDNFHIQIGEQISGDYYSIDKTYADIFAVILAGKDYVTCSDVDLGYPYVGIASINNNTVIAFGISATFDNMAYLDGYLILPNDTAMHVHEATIIPTKTSQLTNDSGFITSYTETDPTVPSWAKASSKPTYTASEVGALPSSTIYVSKITTTAGTHTAISNKSGAVSFNVPTTAAHVGIKFGYTTSGNNRAVLQDSSGNLYVTQKDDNTTYSAGTGLSLSSGSFSVKTGYTTSGNNRAVQADSNGNLYVVQTDNNTTYSAGTGLSLSSTTFSVKLGYTTSGNNRAVQADTNGNLYVVQKDDNTTYSSKAAASGGTDVSLVTTGEKYTWNSKTSNTGTITSVKTTAGAHSTINITSGAANFNVPTKTSHLTNDSGFTTNTGTVTSVAASGRGGITIGGSPITSSGTITVGLNLSTAINGLSEGTAPAQLNDYAVVQYAGGGTTTTSYHRRKLTNLIVGKAVADQNGDTINTTYLKLTGGNVTGPTTFGDTVSIDDLNAEQLVVSGSASFANNLQANTINGVTVGNSPKFTDTVTTATTTGSGNAVTAITASNGALTVTKGTTFLTSHNTYTVSTTGSGNAVTAVSLSGTTFTVTKGATYSNNAGTITSVKTTAGAHTAINTTSGAVSFNVPTTAAHVGIKFGYTTSGNNRAVLQDSSGNLYVTQKDSNTTYSAGTGLSLSSTTFSVKLGYTTSGNNRAVQADSNGNLYVTQKDNNTTYSSKAAASGGTDVSLVTTGEKYTWNSKTSNTGTITSVKTTAGAHTAINVTSGAANFNVPTTAAHVGIKFGYTTSGNNRAVLQDSSGNLYVTQKDSNTTYSAGTGLSLSSTTFSLATSGVTAGSYGATNESTAILGGHSGIDELGITVDKYGRVTDVKVKPLSIYAGDILCANAASNTSTSVTSTITQIPLTQTLVDRDYHSNLSLASNRIAITTAGTYRITGSVYITTTKASSVGVYIMKGSGAFSSATEIASSYIYVGIASSNSINVTKIIQKTSTTAEYIYLAGRASAGGTVASGNVATYLEVEELRF